MGIVKMNHVGTVLNCDFNGCNNDGLWKPVVKFGSSEAVLDLRVCSVHKRVEPSLFIEIAWKAFGTVPNPPAKFQAEVCWDKWHPGIIIIDG